MIQRQKKQHRQNELRRLLSAFKILLTRAGFLACSFLFFTDSIRAADNLWHFDSETQKIHKIILNLQTEQAYALLRSLKTNEYHKMYIQSLCETLDVLISEDEEKFNRIETNFRDRFKRLDAMEPTAEVLFLKAELNLQRGFNFLNLGQEFNAVWAIRNAYNLTQECLKKYPAFVPIKKTSGVIQVMVGSVPDKYHWFMTLLGMKGSVVTGQKQLEDLRQSKSSLSIEATILYYTIKGLINQQIEESTKGFTEALKHEPSNRLLLFLTINMLMKDSQSEQALKLIHTLEENPNGLPMHYIDYLKGEVLLQKGNYQESIAAYQKFIQHYKSDNFKKDSYFKISLAYWLQNKKDLAKANFEKAKLTGRSVAEPDKYADAQLKEGVFPNAKILKVRLATDGGYYEEARNTLHTITPADLISLKDQTEYYYRKARLAHKTHELSAARIFYEQTIDMAGENPWYFAPNSALQLGYIAQEGKDYASARVYFSKALSYKRHEYKNSIDGKARSALDQIKL
jgi:tetratricopeptide (TPR) repeat protein